MLGLGTHASHTKNIVGSLVTIVMKKSTDIEFGITNTLDTTYLPPAWSDVPKVRCVQLGRQSFLVAAIAYDL